MNKTIRKLINNNCGIQDGAIIIGYIEDILRRNEKAIDMLEGEILFSYDQIRQIEKVISLLKGEDNE